MDLKSNRVTVYLWGCHSPQARGKEEMSQGTLRPSKWERESEERERVNGYRVNF